MHVLTDGARALIAGGDTLAGLSNVLRHLLQLGLAGPGQVCAVVAAVVAYQLHGGVSGMLAGCAHAHGAATAGAGSLQAKKGKQNK